MKAPTSFPPHAHAPSRASRTGTPANADTLLRCNSCGKESRTSFVRSLSKGWERCCEGTMGLVRTEAKVEDAVSQLPTLEEVVQARRESAEDQ